jgi:GNAT superfamily N-acetyltransferase
MLKACVWPEAMAAALPPRWSLDPMAHMMTLADLGRAAPILPAGYRLIADDMPTATVRILTADGDDAASGIVTLSEGYAVHNSIRTDARYRRRGLGCAVMAALGRIARDRGATRGLLSSTADGLGLYTALGWDYHMPYTTAVIRAPRIDQGAAASNGA